MVDLKTLLDRLRRPEVGFRHEVTRRYISPEIKSRKLSVSYPQVFSGCCSLVKSAPHSIQAILNLRDFHEKNLLRIVDLYKKNRDDRECANQMADLRKAIAIQVFRLAAAEHKGNYGLALGGSVIKGDHTFLTDIDTVVIAAREEDQAAAQKVQSLMAKILESINIEGDTVMPYNFDGLSVKVLEAKFPSVKAEEGWDPFMKSKHLSDGSFYRFLMDIQIIDTAGNVKAAEYTQKLDDYRERAIYSNPAAMRGLCEQPFSTKLSIINEIQELRTKEIRTPTEEKRATYDIKNEGTRPFYYALYAARSQYRVTAASPWEILSQLQSIGIISSEEMKSAIQALDLALRVRHIIGFVLPEASDAKYVDRSRLQQISTRLKMDEAELRKMIEISTLTLRNISENIFSRLKGNYDHADVSDKPKFGSPDAHPLATASERDPSGTPAM